MDLPIVNLAGQKVRGFDATVDYVLNTDSAGKFDFASTAVIYNSYRVKALPTERYYQYAGYATEGGSGSNGTLPKWRTYTTVNWSFRGLELLLANTYIPSVTDIGPGGSAPQAPLKVDSFTSFDFAASYNIKSTWLKNLKVTLGVNNISNEMPPLAPNAFTDANADIGTYGAIGRFFYVDASYKF
jgi:iron complex outermembrane receptor protein